MIYDITKVNYNKEFMELKFQELTLRNEVLSPEQTRIRAITGHSDNLIFMCLDVSVARTKARYSIKYLPVRSLSVYCTQGEVTRLGIEVYKGTVREEDLKLYGQTWALIDNELKRTAK